MPPMDPAPAMDPVQDLVNPVANPPVAFMQDEVVSGLIFYQVFVIHSFIVP